MSLFRDDLTLPRYLLIARINRRFLAARIATDRASKSTRTPESVSRSIDSRGIRAVARAKIPRRIRVLE